MKKETSAAIVLTLISAACGGGSSTYRAEAITKQAHVELSPGTTFAIRLDRALSTARNRRGDSFGGTLEQPVRVNGTEVIPQGTKFTGHVTASQSSGRLDGRGVLDTTLDAFDLNGQRYPIATSIDARATEAHKKRNLELIGGGAGVGALVGGLTGGGKGAAIGAGVGAAGGAGVAAATGRKEIEIPAETLVRFSLKRPVDIAQ